MKSSSNQAMIGFRPFEI